jgi:WD40 repeat protein
MIQLWNPKTFTVVKTLQRSSVREAEVSNLWFLDSTRTLVSRDVIGRLRYRNLTSSVDTTWHESFPFSARGGYVNRDGKRFAAVSRGERELVIWDCDSTKIVTTIDGVSKDFLRVWFAAEGDLVLTAERNDTLEIWSRSSGALLQTVDLGGWGETMATSATGSDLVTASGKELRFWSLHWPNPDSRPVLVERFRISGIAAKVQSLAYTNSDHTITFARSDSNISRFKITNRPTMTTWKTEMPLIQSIAVSPSKPILATLGRDYSVALWDTRKGSKLRTLMGGGSGVVPKPAPHAIAISPNGALLACVQPGPNTKLWNLATAASGATLAGRWRWTQSLAFSPDNTLLAVSGNEGFITLWNTRNQTEIRTLRRSTSPTHSLSFDPGGKILACATVNGWANSIDLWDVESGNPIRSLTKDVPYVRCISLAKSVDASLLASGHEDGSIRIWDYSNVTKPILLSGHGNMVSGLTFAIKGSVLISSSEDGTIKLWESQGGAELATIFIFGDNDWAATTPGGYFDGTREGMKRVVLLEQDNRLMNERSKLRHRKAGLLAKILESRAPR